MAKIRSRVGRTSKPASRPLDRRDVFAAAALGVLALLPFWGSLQNGFVWDDPLVLRQLRAFREWTDLLVMPPEVPQFYYRPVIFMSYLIDRGLGGETPWWFHFSVVACHAVNTALVFVVARSLFGFDLMVSAGGAALFAVLPTHVESVAWMAGRSDVIVCAFLLIMSVAFCSRTRMANAWLGGAAYFAALLSKEMAIGGLILVPAFDWLQNRRLYWARYVPLVVATVVYFVLRYNSLGTVVGGAPVPHHLSELVVEIARALGFYVSRTIWPFGLSPYVPTVPVDSVYLLLGLGVPLAMGVVIWRRWSAARFPLSVLVAWFLLFLAPSLTVVVRASASAPVADRYLYVPSVAGCILISWGLLVFARRWRDGQLWYVATVCLLVVALGVTSAVYSETWRSNLSFWSVVARDLPGSALAQREWGSALLADNDTAAAEEVFGRAVDLAEDPAERLMAVSQLGLVYRRQARFDRAVELFEGEAASSPHPNVYHNLGMALMGRAEEAQRRGDGHAVARDVSRARQALERALEEGANETRYLEQWAPARTHVLLAQVLNSLGDRDEARRQLMAALDVEPTGPVADVARRYLATIGGE